MEFRPLRSFVEVVRQGGFSQAARTVLVTQSSVSKAVKQLEDELGMPLLTRQGHRSELTAAGEIVFRRGLKMLADRDALLAELDEFRNVRRGVLRLGLQPICGSGLFTPLIARFRQLNPDTEVRVVEQDAAQLDEGLRTGQLDFVGLVHPVPTECDWMPLYREPLYALLPSHHPCASQASLRLAHLMDTPFVLFENHFTLQQNVLDACRKAGFEPQVAARSSQIDFMVDLVGMGLGAAFLPRRIALQHAHDSVCHVPVSDPSMEWEMAIAWRPETQMSGAADAWLSLARETRRALG
jgi:DNA-binding transcriptional LysR family regulator